MRTTKVPIQLELSEAALGRVNTPNSVSLWNGIAPPPFVYRGGEHTEPMDRHCANAEGIPASSRGVFGTRWRGKELYAKAALLELAAEFREKAEGLEHYGAWHEA